MGCGKSKDLMHTQCEATLAIDKKRMENEIKLLLLGPGESGKTTLARQIKLIYGEGYAETELRYLASVIRLNVAQIVRQLYDGVCKLGMPIEEWMDDLAQQMSNSDVVAGQQATRTNWTPDVVQQLGNFWNHPSVAEAVQQRETFQLNDNTEYFMSMIGIIADDNYLPSIDDVLHIRTQTTGIIERDFTVEDIVYRLIDVGGQRTERSKWLHCFDDVTCVIYCSALSDYDLMLFEDEAVNRMDESLDLFKKTINHEALRDKSILLVLTKADILRYKLVSGKSISQQYPEFKGMDSFDETVAFIRDMFLERTEHGQQVYTHIINATFTPDVEAVLADVQEIIVSHNLQLAGIGT